MWMSAVIKGQISANAGTSFRNGLVDMKTNLLVFDRQPPRQNRAADPINDGVEIDEASRHWNIRQIHRQT
jgi:hypothetical protein